MGSRIVVQVLLPGMVTQAYMRNFLHLISERRNCFFRFARQRGLFELHMETVALQGVFNPGMCISNHTGVVPSHELCSVIDGRQGTEGTRRRHLRYRGVKCSRAHLLFSGSFLSEISVRSPQLLFIFIIYKNIFWMKVSQKAFI